MQDIEKNKSAMLHFLQGMMEYLKPEEDIEMSGHEDSEETLYESCNTKHTRQVIKQFDEEEMVAIEPLYITVGEVDAHGDGITESELRKMIDNFNKNIDNIKGNIHHLYMTEGFKPVKAWINECDCYIGETLVPEGQPIVKIKFFDEDLWKKRKEGICRGVSIGATGKRVDNPDYVGDE